MKPLLFALLILALGVPVAAATQQRLPLRITAYDTHSGIMVTQFSFLRVRDAHQGSVHGSTVVIAHGQATTQVDFHFVFYDRLHDHAGEAELVRTGSFTSNTPIEANFANVNGDEDTKDCVLLPRHDPPLALAIAFVKSATFADGSQWVTSGPAIAEHLDP
jgi:hypothetical protein